MTKITTRPLVTIPAMATPSLLSAAEIQNGEVIFTLILLLNPAQTN